MKAKWSACIDDSAAAETLISDELLRVLTKLLKGCRWLVLLSWATALATWTWRNRAWVFFWHWNKIMEHDEDQTNKQAEEGNGDTNVLGVEQVLEVSPSARCLSRTTKPWIIGWLWGCWVVGKLVTNDTTLSTCIHWNTCFAIIAFKPEGDGKSCVWSCPR